MKDLHSSLSAVMAAGAAVMTETAAGDIVDLLGFQSAEVVLSIGIGGVTFTDAIKIDFVLEHSDDGTTFAAVSDDELIGVTGVESGVIKSLVAAHATADVSRYGYKGSKRYLRLTPTFTGTHATGTPISAVILKGHGTDNPQADQA